MRAVRIKIDVEVMRDLLGLPRSVNIMHVVHCHAPPNCQMRSFELWIEDDSFPEIPRGLPIPEVRPVFNKDGFVDWGLDGA